jgi:inorganic triphosphatase YgiF
VAEDAQAAGGWLRAWLYEYRKRSEQALASAIQEAVPGALGIAGVSAGQVSRLWAAREEKSAKANAADVVRQLQGRFARAMEIFEAGRHRTRTCSNDPTGRLNQEIRRPRHSGP